MRAPSRGRGATGDAGGRRYWQKPGSRPDAQIPEQWECRRCGYPTSRDKDNPPAPPKVEPYKTHLAYVRERRDDRDGEALLNEALEELRARKS